MSAGSALRTMTGVSLLCAAAGFGGYSLAWTLRSHLAAGRVLAAARRELAESRGYDAARSCAASAPATGQLAGLLRIPGLGLTAPVEQGETDAVLSAAVGHDPASVMPGAAGTAVLAAHDVSYFSGIARLRPGDTVQYVGPCDVVTFSVTGHHVVPAGSPVSQSSSPELVLDTCWPTNALWWTPDRFLVTAVETSIRPTASNLGTAGQGGGGARSAATGGRPLAVAAPEALVAQGLTLDTNPTLLGEMGVGGGAARGFEESPEPMSVEAAALTAYYGGLHSIDEGRSDWWSAIAPGVAWPGSLAGSSITEYVTRLGVEVLAHGMQPTGAVLSATVDLRQASGATVPGRLTVSCVAHGGTLQISRWLFEPVSVG